MAKATQNAATGTAVKPELLRTISMKALLGMSRGDTIELAEGEKTRDVGVIAGVITGYTTGSTQYGQYVKFKGNFRGIGADGKLYTSARCFVPQPWQNELQEAVDNAERPDKDGVVGRCELQFAIKIALKKVSVKESKTGYVYVTDSLMDASATNLADEVMNKVYSALPENLQKALPAPAK